MLFGGREEGLCTLVQVPMSYPGMRYHASYILHGKDLHRPGCQAQRQRTDMYLFPYTSMVATGTAIWRGSAPRRWRRSTLFSDQPKLSRETSSAKGLFKFPMM